MSAFSCSNANPQSMTTMNAAATATGGNPPSVTAGSTGAGSAGNHPATSAGSGGNPAATVTGSGGSSTIGSSGSGGAAAGATSSSAGAGGAAIAGTSAAGSTASAAGASGDTSGAAGSAGAAGMMSAPHEDLGKGDGHDVVLMGDSWMSNTLQLEGTGGGIAPSLQAAAGQPYPNYAVQGVMLLSADTFGPAIPTQWDTAKRLGSGIKTVVMTGGGNDVIQNPGLQSDCMMDGDQCKKFRMDLIAALDKLWTQMAADGVQDIIYVRYASQAGSGMMPSTSSSTPMVPSICTSGKVRCHSLATDDLVNGELAIDNIHPLVTANDRMAKALVDMMKSEGMRR